MSVKIRLARRGRKKRPFYHIVIADARAPRDGRFIEKIGMYNPMTSPATIDIDRDKAFEWLLKGAQPTDTVRAMLRFKGVMYRKHLHRGVLKGAMTQEEADKLYEQFINEKEAKVKLRFEQTAAEKIAYHEKISGIAQPIVEKVEEVPAETEKAEEVAAEPAEPIDPLQAAIEDNSMMSDVFGKDKPKEEAKPEPVAAAPVVEKKVEEAPVVEEKVEEVVEEAPVVEEKVEEVVEETPVVEEKVEEAPAKEEKKDVKPDDLKKIEGIGPKIAELLVNAGIPTFKALSETDSEKIKEILAEAGSRYRMHNPTTWPKQAGLAAEGKWDELKKWQDELDGGK